MVSEYFHVPAKPEESTSPYELWIRTDAKLASMKNFMVLYKMPPEGLEEWMKKPEAERKGVEDAMKAEWDQWLAAHKDAVQNTVGLGSTKLVSASGVETINNGLMLSSYVAGESAETVAELFKNHPHLAIPGATIEIMETTPLPADRK